MPIIVNWVRILLSLVGLMKDNKKEYVEFCPNLLQPEVFGTPTFSISKDYNDKEDILYSTMKLSSIDQMINADLLNWSKISRLQKKNGVSRR